MEDKNKAEEILNEQNETNQEINNEQATAENVENEVKEETAEEKLAKSEEEVAKLKKEILYKIAEFDNYRKRTSQEKAELMKYAGAKVITTILPVIDDMELALKNMDKMEDVEAIKDGVKLIFDKFFTLLKAEGLKKIEATGQNFDVDFHEAIAMIPAPTEELKGKVIDCTKTGYTLNDKVIRHAQVAVGQ